jgi:hypothetical protein
MAWTFITTGTRYLLNGTSFIVREGKQDNYFLVEDEQFGSQQTITLQELLNAWTRGILRFEVPKRRPGTPPETPVPTRYPPPDVTSISEPLHKEMLRREAIVRATLEKQMTRKQIQEYAAQLRMQENDPILGSHQHAKSRYACSAESIERWRKAYIKSGYDIRALMPVAHTRGGKGRKRLPAEIEAIYQEMFQTYRNHPRARTRQGVMNDLFLRIDNLNLERPDSMHLQAPSWSTTYRRMHEKGLSLIPRRSTRRKAKAPHAVTQSLKPTWFQEHVEIDATHLPVFLVDQQDRLLTGYPALTILLDTKRGFPLEIQVSIEPPGYRAIQNALSHAMLPKNKRREVLKVKRTWHVDGQPRSVVTSQWREVTYTRGALQQPLAIQLHTCPQGGRASEQETSCGGAEPTQREVVSQATPIIIRSERFVQDVACFQDIPGIGTVFFEAVVQPVSQQMFGRFTDLPPTSSSALDLITAVFDWYAQKGSRPLEVWTDYSALYRGEPAHPYERYLTKQGVVHYFWVSPQVKSMAERYFRIAEQFFTIIRGTQTPWTLDRLWTAFEEWIMPAGGDPSQASPSGKRS